MGVHGIGSIIVPTEKGYTGHKMMSHVGIIHMNGRIYDPTIGRFLQADPHIQAPMNSQNYNRYSYVLNNPLSYTDPSGYFFVSLFKGVRKFVKKYWRSIVSIGLTIWAPWGTGFWASVATGAVAGAVTTGSLRGALTGAFTAGIFHGIGTHFQGLQDSAGVLSAGARAGKVLAHGLAGGISSVLSGGKFGHGFASAGFTQAFSGAIDKIGGRIGNITKGDYFSTANRATRIVASAVVGGTASVISGGKFANGAITAAFSRGFNDEAHFQANIDSFFDRFTEGAKNVGGGLLDSFSFGHGQEITEYLGGTWTVDESSWAYTGGEIASMAVGGLGIYRAAYSGTFKLASMSKNMNFLEAASDVRNFTKRFGGKAIFSSAERAKIKSFNEHVATKGFDSARAGLGRTRGPYNNALIPMSPGIGGGFNDD